MTDNRPVIASYCATFLPREMWHVYRQVTNVRSYRNTVITRTRRNEDIFPYENLLQIPKSKWRWIWRFLHKLRSPRIPLSPSETCWMTHKLGAINASLLHVYLGSEALRLLSVLRQYKGARIVSFHGADLSNEISNKEYQALWECADLFLCRSESLKEQLLEKGCPENRIRLNYTGVPCIDTWPERQSPRTDETLKLFQACRFIDKKGLDLTLDAVSLLLGKGLKIHLTLAGDGPLKSSLEEQSSRLGISDNVTFTGFLSQEKLSTYYLKSHLFLHPSRTTWEGDREGIPNSIAEAMSFGLPVVSTRHSGIPEIITDRGNGFLMEHNTAANLAATIKDALSDPARYLVISRNAHQKIKDRFSLAACADCLESLYAEAIALREKDHSIGK